MQQLAQKRSIIFASIDERMVFIDENRKMQPDCLPTTPPTVIYNAQYIICGTPFPLFLQVTKPLLDVYPKFSEKLLPVKNEGVTIRL